jgi:hypothetical protein
MITIGERPATWRKCSRRAAKHYDYEVEYAVSKMSELWPCAVEA